MTVINISHCQVKGFDHSEGEQILFLASFYLIKKVVCLENLDILILSLFLVILVRGYMITTVSRFWITCLQVCLDF